MPFLEISEEIVNHSVIEIFSSQMGISSGCLDFKNSFLNGQKRDIECTTSQIENKYILFVSLLVQTVRDGSGSGFIDDTKHIESRDGSSILGSLTLGVVKVGRNGDDSILNFLTQIGLGDILHLGKNHGTDLFSLESLFFSLVFNLDDRGASRSGNNSKRPVLHVRLNGGIGKFASDQSLGIKNGVVSVHRSLGLGSISDKTFSLSESYVRRGGTVTLVVGNDFNTVILPHSNTRVRGSEINSDGFSSDGSHCLFD
mmetsp:Transcript_18509/g.40283  ORF Transcript_18509/g.40283 Transcript_18509/m.40283 type:complete len:256 (+) Transcript_18509:402-1169(+)